MRKVNQMNSPHKPVIRPNVIDLNVCRVYSKKRTEGCLNFSDIFVDTIYDSIPIYVALFHLLDDKVSKIYNIKTTCKKEYFVVIKFVYSF